MSKTKTTTVLGIIGNSVKLYAQNMFTLTLPVITPVLGMLLSLILILLPVYFLPVYYPNWAEKYPVFNEFATIISIIIISILPGLIIFKLAFWNYMLKVVSLNNIIGDIIKRKVVKPHKHYTQIVALRTKDYLLMLFIWCLMILMGLILPFAVYLFDWTEAFQQFLFIGLEFVAIFLLTILSIYLSLSFQVFSFQTDLGPMQTLEESFRLVLNNFWRLVAIIFALTCITLILIPEIFVFLADVLMIKTHIAYPFKIILEKAIANNPGISEQLQAISLMANYDSQEKLILETSKLMSINIIRSLISLLMLPFGSCLYTLFYFDAQKKLASKTQQDNKEETTKKTTKKAKKK